jgi:hypothetical protein
VIRYLAALAAVLVLAACGSQASPRTRVVTRIVHEPAVTRTVIRVRTRWRTRTVYGTPSAPCHDEGPGAVYVPWMGAASGPLVQCTISFYSAVPASAGTYMELTAPSGDTGSFLLVKGSG